MTTKGWRNSWTTPGQSELTSPKLDHYISRDLLVGRNVHIKGNLTLDGNFALWQSYTPTLVGYQAAAGLGTPTGQGGPKVATGINYSTTGRYVKIGKTIVFEFVVNIISHLTGYNWNSNPYVDVPFPVNSQFAASGGYHSGSSPNDDSTWIGLFAIAKPNASNILVVPVTNNPGTAVVLMSAFAVPYMFTVSGTYESV
jgi:hypothetical protein